MIATVLAIVGTSSAFAKELLMLIGVDLKREAIGTQAAHAISVSHKIMVHRWLMLEKLAILP